MSSRLFQEIREKRGLVYSIYCYPSFYRDCGLFGIYAGTGPDDIDELIPAICEEIKRLPTTLTDREIARARPQLKAATMMSLESTGARCEQLGQQMLIFGRPLTLEEQVGKIESVGEEAVHRISERIFTGKPTIAAIGPVNQIMSYDELVAALADIKPRLSNGSCGRCFPIRCSGMQARSFGARRSTCARRIGATNVNGWMFVA